MPSPAVPLVALVAAVALASGILGAVQGPDPDPASGPRAAVVLGAGPIGEPGEGLWAARRGGTGQVYAAALARSSAVPASLLASLRPWALSGPRVIGGRLTDLALHPDGHTVYAASASGGLWASTDAGATLRPLWPADLTPAIGAVAVTADGVLLVGTGEANAGGGSLTYGGTGVYRSADDGATWVHAGLATSGTVARIEPHPTDPDVVFLAAGGDLFGPGGERGIYRSTDAGRTWDLVLAPATATAGGADLAIDPADPDHLLAAMWDRRRTADARRYGGAGSGVYRSTDGGDTWQPVEGLPGFQDDSGRVAVAFSPADPRRVYAVVTRGDGRAGGLWRSDDGDVTWQRVDDSPLYEPAQFIFAWWFGRVFPSPTDADRVLVPGLSLLESLDGGVTFDTDARVHADQHDLIWDPGDPRRAHLATDGGLYTSDDGGASLTWRAAQDQPFTQAYDVAVYAHASSAADGGALAGGFQDVGCLVTDGAAGVWRRSSGCGDGTRVLAHPERVGEAILCGQYGRCSTTTGHGSRSARLPMPATARQAWAAPIIRLPGSPDSLLFAGDTVHRSDDGGQSWRQVSPDLTGGQSPDPDYPFGTVTALAAGPADPGAGIAVGQVLAAGTDDGRVWTTTDGGSSWAQVAHLDRWVTSLVVDAELGLLVGTSGYRSGDDTAQVLAIRDGEVTDLDEGLPDAPVNDLVVVDAPGDPALVAATDVGVFLARDVGTGPPSWQRVGPDLPQAPVMALDWVEGTRQLIAGTYGRGVWNTRLPALTRHAGEDRYATAAAVARTHAGGLGPQDGGTVGGTVVLASGADFPDALTAAALVAADPSARLVLTGPGALPEDSRQLIAEGAPTRLVVIGGERAVGGAVAAQAVTAAGTDPVVTRLAGTSRYATAAAVAGEVPVDTVVLATAGSPFDALAGAPLAAALGAPVLLVDPDRVPAETAAALDRLAPSRVIALGGTAAISEATLVEAASQSGAAADRVAGTDRIATAVAIAALQGEGPDAWLATAADFPDALAAAATGAPVLLTPRDTLPAAVLGALEVRGPWHIRVAGGEDGVGRGVLDALRGTIPAPGHR